MQNTINNTNIHTTDMPVRQKKSSVNVKKVKSRASSIQSKKKVNALKRSPPRSSKKSIKKSKSLSARKSYGGGVGTFDDLLGRFGLQRRM